MKYAIILKAIVSREEIEKVWPAHVTHIEKLHTEGRLIAAGPFADGRGGMMLIDAESYEAAQAIAEADPFIIEKVLSYELWEWQILSEVIPELLTRSE